MSADQVHNDRLEELLVARAVDGLEPVESAELEALLAEHGHADPDGYDLAAASVWLAVGAAGEPMPEAVAARSRRTLERTVAAGEPVRAEKEGEPGAANVRPLRRPSRPGRTAAVSGWLAAAAALVVAVAGWWPQAQSSQPTAAELTAARDDLLRNAADAVKVSWTNTEHPRAQRLEGGYVVWSDARQRGYMTFKGMPDNDPSEHQYQLWVFDATRSDDHPVDGGVFDARRNAAGEVVIPIENKLPVRQAKLFAVTLEPPGGVVVSDRDPILWVAEPTSS